MPHCIRKMLAWHNSIYRPADDSEPVARSAQRHREEAAPMYSSRRIPGLRRKRLTREQAMPQPRTAVPRRQVQQRRPRSSNIAISQLWP